MKRIHVGSPWSRSLSYKADLGQGSYGWSLKASPLWTVSMLMIRVFYWQASAGSLTCWGGVSPSSAGSQDPAWAWDRWWRTVVRVGDGKCLSTPSLFKDGSSNVAWTPLALLGWTIHLWGGCSVELCVPLDNAALLGVPVPVWVCWWVLYFPGMLCFWRFLLSFSAIPDREGIETPWCSSPLHPRWGPVSPRSLEGPIRVSACVERCPGLFLFLLCLLCLAWYHLK